MPCNKHAVGHCRCGTTDTPPGYAGCDCLDDGLTSLTLSWTDACLDVGAFADDVLAWGDTPADRGAPAGLGPGKHYWGGLINSFRVNCHGVNNPTTLRRMVDCSDDGNSVRLWYCWAADGDCPPVKVLLGAWNPFGAGNSCDPLLLTSITFAGSTHPGCFVLTPS